MAEKGRGFDRRSMLKRTALTGGALLVPGGLARGAMENGATGTDGDRPVRRLGLLLPSGKECASVARAIRAGVLDATTTTSCRVVTVEQKRTVRQEIEELFYEENLDAVICFANTNCAADLAEVANAARRPVYLVDSGVNPIDHRAYSPYLRVATLDLFEKNREIGRVAAQRGKRRGIALISVSEAGYQTPDAIRQGFEQEGGAIERYIVVDRPELDAIDHDGIRAAIAEVQPDTLFLLGDHSVMSDVERVLPPFAGRSIVRNHREDIAAGLRRLGRRAAGDLVGITNGEVAATAGHTATTADHISGVVAPFLG